MGLERGFLAGPMLWGAIASAAVIGALGIAVTVQSHRLKTCQDEFAAFKLQTKLIGEMAEAAAKRKESADIKAKEKSDAQHQATVARLNRDLKRLRDERSSSGALSSVPTNPANPTTACFDREKLERAVSGFVEGAATLVGRGQQAVEDLDEAGNWAQATLKP